MASVKKKPKLVCPCILLSIDCKEDTARVYRNRKCVETVVSKAGGALAGLVSRDLLQIAEQCKVDDKVFYKSRKPRNGRAS